MGCIAYVPDLGMDLVRQFFYDKETRELVPIGTMCSGPTDSQLALGPRYIEFHKQLPAW